MREALQKQINEKNRIKEEEKRKQKESDIKDEIRVREQMHEMAIAEGFDPSKDPETAQNLSPLK